MLLKEKKLLTPEEKYKMNLQAETELVRLQRQYNILESERNGRGTSSALSKQQKVINILRREYNDILQDLNIAASDGNAKQDARAADQLTSLLKEHTTFLEDINMEKAYLSELDTQITITKKSIIDLRSRTITEVQCTQQIEDGRRILEALENKLECATKRFCTTVTDNRRLRAEIDHLLKERAHFNKLWDKLVSNLAQGKKFMLDLIEQATIAYDQREEWCQKLNTLQTKALNEYLLHVQEMTVMQRQIDHETKLQNFLRIKGQRRIMKNLLEKEQKRRDQNRKEMEKLIEHYNNMLEDIKEFMGEDNLYKIIKKFAGMEMENFSLFQYVNELNMQLEDLSDELVKLQMRIDEQKVLNDLRTWQQEKEIEDLEQELQFYTTEACITEDELKNTENNIRDLLNGIDKVFKLCKCSNAPLLDLLGDNSKITTHNALLYLGALETRVNELIINVYFKEKKAAETRMSTTQGMAKAGIIKNERVRTATVPVTKLVSKDPCPLCVEQAMVSDVIDSLQKVLDKESITEYLEEAIDMRGFGEVVHNVSGCHLPKSRAIIQKRFQ